jgi:hypothetical protein
MAFFSKTKVMIKILHNLAFFESKTQIYFAEFFGNKKVRDPFHMCYYLWVSSKTGTGLPDGFFSNQKFKFG